MSREIKIDASEIKQVLQHTKQSGAQMNTKLPTTIKGRNQLLAADTLERINQQLNELSTSYIGILQKQLVQTEQAVNTMIETDKALASSNKRK
ncbi:MULTISPECIES: YwqI/YxiC family protein [Bacillus]|uniref:YwqI/YxiC family protein n=1 Tax=Bacillus TaxID=1386 RepID=UPI002ABE6B49|nr:YwqI/YxiC family protein [Bacillus pumilus]